MHDSDRHYLVPAEIYNLTDVEWGNIECVLEICVAFKVVQKTLEGEKYVTCSLVIPMMEEIRESLRSSRASFVENEAPRGVRLMDDLKVEFDKRFGDGTHVTNFREGPCQPMGYTEVSLLWFYLFLSCLKLTHMRARCSVVFVLVERKKIELTAYSLGVVGVSGSYVP